MFNTQVHALVDALRPSSYAAVSLASVDYVNTSAARGFAIYIPNGETGSIKVDTFGGQTVTFTDFGDGEFLRDGLRFKKIYKTGTDINGIEAWY